MYAKKSWGGKETPAIEVLFKKSDKKEVLSFIIYEYEDSNFVGRWTKDGDVPLSCLHFSSLGAY